jgi:hypothetical protein
MLRDFLKTVEPVYCILHDDRLDMHVVHAFLQNQNALDLELAWRYVRWYVKPETTEDRVLLAQYRINDNFRIVCDNRDLEGWPDPLRAEEESTREFRAGYLERWWIGRLFVSFLLQNPQLYDLRTWGLPSPISADQLARYLGLIPQVPPFFFRH